MMGNETTEVHAVNMHLVPKLRFDDYPVLVMPAWAVEIVLIEFHFVLSLSKSISEAREALNAYPHYDSRALLASFDRKLIQALSDCQDRPCPFRP